MTIRGEDTTPTHPALATGRRIEVWNRFLGSFAGDFEIASVADAGYRIRRTSDDAVLPRRFAAEDLRPIM